MKTRRKKGRYIDCSKKSRSETFGQKKKSLNGYNAWVKQGKKDGDETVRYIRVSVEQGSTVAQHVILQQISL